MPEQPCPDPPKKGGCRFDPDTILVDPERLSQPGLFTVVLTREPAVDLAQARQVEVSWRADWRGWSLPERWTFWLEGLVLEEEDDLFSLEGEIAEAARKGATHLLVSLDKKDHEPSDEYVHRLLGLIRSLCDEAGLTFAAAPELKINQYLASANCCRWPKKG